MIVILPISFLPKKQKTNAKAKVQNVRFKKNTGKENFVSYKIIEFINLSAKNKLEIKKRSTFYKFYCDELHLILVTKAII